jgi:aminoglycoside phosphotransferase (APT) family kinase protein
MAPASTRSGGEAGGARDRVPRPEPDALASAASALVATAIELVEPLHGGARRDTYRAVAASGERFVVRLDHDAASLAKEVALTELVAARVPVAAIVGTDLDGEHLGVPLTVSAYADGLALDDALGGAGPDEAARLGDAVGRALAAIGSFAFDRPGTLGPTLVPEHVAPLPELLVGMADRVLAEPGTREVLGGAIADGFRGLLEEAAPTLDLVAGEAALVHADFNGTNLVVADGAVVAVLDWEFAFAGPPLADVGNMLRRQERLPPAFVDGFAAGSEAAGGAWPPGWRSIAATLDALALLDVLDRGARGEHGPMYGEACALIEEAVARGELAPPAPG